MAKIKDTVHMDANGGSDIPDISPEGIAETAWLVWASVLNDHLPTGKVERKTYKRTGQPGFLWHGSVNAVVSELWPTLNGGYVVDKDTAENIRLVLNQYLRESRNLICQRRGGPQYPSVWWVSEHWTALNVRSVGFVEETPEDVGAVIPDESVKTPEKTTGDPFDMSTMAEDDQDTHAPGEIFPCRVVGCTREYGLSRIRSRHEFSDHGYAENKDGTAIWFDPKTKPSGTEVEQMILTALGACDGPQAPSVVWNSLRAIDPRVTRGDSQAGLDRLLARGTIRLNDRSTPYYSYYELAALRVYSAPVAQAASPSGSKFSDHVVNLEALLDDLRSLGGAADELTELRDALTSVTTERDQLLQDLALVDAELTAVKEERDQVQTFLDTLRSGLMGFSKE